jgi:hypothetical protein
MTKKSRYFLVGSAGVLLVGLGGGMLAYMAFHRASALPPGLPAELRYVPADAQMVAYADVHSVMASQMRRELERMTTGRHGQQQMHEFAGIDLEKDVNHVVAFMQAEANAQAADAAQQPPRVLLLAQGQFQQARVEQFIKDHGGVIEDYHGKHLVIRRMDPPPANPADKGASPDAQGPRHVPPEMAIGFVQPDLIAIGPAALVRQALDDSTSTANVTTNADLMAAIRDESSTNAWVVGRFDAVSRRMGLPPAVRTQVPPLRLVSASAHINGGVKATIKAQTADTAAADQLRDVVRGAISFARLQAGSRPELQDALKTVELGGTGTKVQLSFMMTPDTLRALTPHPPAADEPQPQPKQ